MGGNPDVERCIRLNAMVASPTDEDGDNHESVEAQGGITENDDEEDEDEDNGWDQFMSVGRTLGKI